MAPEKKSPLLARGQPFLVTFGTKTACALHACAALGGWRQQSISYWRDIFNYDHYLPSSKYGTWWRGKKGRNTDAAQWETSCNNLFYNIRGDFLHYGRSVVPYASEHASESPLPLAMSTTINISSWLHVHLTEPGGFWCAPLKQLAPIFSTRPPFPPVFV